MIPSAATIHVLNREADFLNRAFLLWTQAFEEGLRRRNFFCAALSGGKTPIPFYRELARRNRQDFWKKTHLFLVDERFDPPVHPESNGRMIAENLASPAGISAGNFHSIPLNQKTAEDSARAYEESLRDFFRLKRDEFPSFDFILLGIGEDGHTASLFPGTSAPEETGRVVVAVNLMGSRRDRVTLTLPVLNRGGKVVFLVQGDQKAEIVGKIIAEEDPSLPAARVRPHSGGPIFLLDGAAGKNLPVGGWGKRGIP